MAQIKKKLKPGQAIIKAKTGNVAALDKDGNIIGTPIQFDEVMIDPVGGSQGDVLTKRNGGGYSWQPVPKEIPEIDESDVGDILYAGENGPYWGLVPGYIEDLTEELEYDTDFDTWIDTNSEIINNLAYQFLKIGDFQYHLTLRLQVSDDVNLVPNTTIMLLFTLPTDLQNKLVLVPMSEHVILNLPGPTLTNEHVNAFSFDDVLNLDTYGSIYVDNKIKLRGYKNGGIDVLADGVFIIDATFIKIV